MPARSCFPGFERDVLPHLNSAYNVARWLTRNDQDAEDIVQKAYLRPLGFYRSFQGGAGCPWLLTIVRNVYHTRWWQNSARRFVDFDEDLANSDPHLANSGLTNPEEALIEKSKGVPLRRALAGAIS